jgi:hypothetical protein
MRFGHRISSLKYFVVFLSSSRQLPGIVSRFSYDPFLSNPFKFISRQSISHTMSHNLNLESVFQKPRMKEQIWSMEFVIIYSSKTMWIQAVSSNKMYSSCIECVLTLRDEFLSIKCLKHIWRYVRRWVGHLTELGPVYWTKSPVRWFSFPSYAQNSI